MAGQIKRNNNLPLIQLIRNIYIYLKENSWIIYIVWFLLIVWYNYRPILLGVNARADILAL
jgi:hypothetical protein